MRAKRRVNRRKPSSPFAQNKTKSLFESSAGRQKEDADEDEAAGSQTIRTCRSRPEIQKKSDNDIMEDNLFSVADDDDMELEWERLGKADTSSNNK